MSLNTPRDGKQKQSSKDSSPLLPGDEGQGPTSPEGDGLAKRLAQGNLLTSGLSSSEESSSDAGYLQERTDASLIRTTSGHAEPDEGFDPLSLHRNREGEFHPCFDTVGGNPPEFGRSLQNGLPQGADIAPGGALVSSRRVNAGGSPQGGFDEVAQLLRAQHKQLSALMGGIMPASLEQSRGNRVLDVGWGVGGLVYEMAWRYPSLHITGIETNASVLQKSKILVRGLDNVSIFANDIHSFDDKVFPPAWFDLIYLRFLAGDVMVREFAPLMQSLGRICRPGGLFIWTETEMPITTSLACQHLCKLLQSGLQASGRAFSPGNSLGVTMSMGRWLDDAGCRITQNLAYAIDISAGSKGNDAFIRQWRFSGEQIHTFLLKMGVTTEAEFEEIFSEMQREITEENFCGLLYLRMLVGVRL